MILNIGLPLAIIWAVFFCFIIAFVFVIFIFYRQKRESYFRQKEAELAQQVAEVEMKVLRSQMNPHFIFNALNSVHHFMEKNDLKNAGEYLLKVSALMRRVLENSMHQTVSLEDDMKALILYIEIEQMRLQQSFQFAINIAEDIISESIYVPPLIIQPFIENSIWHGLKNRKENGFLSVNIFKKNEMLHYVIDDNGELNNQDQTNYLLNDIRKKSLGINITKERLDVLNKTNNSNANFILSDKLDDQNNYLGKRVLLQLPLEEL